jgi:sarcosine oxidase subunit gamma
MSETFEGYVRVELLLPQGMITLRGDFSDDGFADAVAGVTGETLPGPRQMTHHGAGALGWMSPDELLYVLPYSECQETLATLREALAGMHHLAENVSDARVMFQLTGEHVREVLAKLAPVDLHPDHFAQGELRRTRLAQIPAAFWLTGKDTAQVICFRSVADYAFGLLKCAAMPGGQVGTMNGS